MARQRFARVWDALEDTAAEAASMRARSALMIAVRTKIESWKVSQVEAARRVGLTQPCLNDLMRGRIDKFSLDALINLREAGWARGTPANRGSRVTPSPLPSASTSIRVRPSGTAPEGGLAEGIIRRLAAIEWRVTLGHSALGAIRFVGVRYNYY